jgi:hypothetical protein
MTPQSDLPGPMKVGFVETRDFVALVSEYFVTDDNYRAFQNFLNANPERGAVIPGTGGIRKIRWADPRRGKGKRGGLRVLYIYVPEARFLGFLHVYDKDEADDLTTEEKKELSVLAAAFRAHLLVRDKRIPE